MALAIAASAAMMAAACGEVEREKSDPVMQTAEKPPQQPTRTVKKSDEEWRSQLTPEQYRILRNSGTERAWGKVYEEFKHQGEGTYYCAGCNAELFTSKQKFDSRCGWPSFFDASQHKNIKTVRDTSGGMVRVEVRCNVCDGHLGHIFEGEGFNTPTDQRYCINGVVLKFVPTDGGGAEKEDPGKKSAATKKEE